jgi:hypothetical protein
MEKQLAVGLKVAILIAIGDTSIQAKHIINHHYIQFVFL